MNKVTLQVPIDKSLKVSAEKVADEFGFSSLQEVMRIFLKKFATKKITFTMEEQIYLSPQAEKRYSKMIEDIESGKVKTYKFSTVDSLMKHLHNGD